jgi:hypothetical protein
MTTAASGGLSLVDDSGLFEWKFTNISTPPGLALLGDFCMCFGKTMSSALLYLCQ